MPVQRMSSSAARPRPSFVASALLACLVGASAPAWANKPPDVTAGEIALLPSYCPDTMGFGYGDAYSNTSPRAPHWVALMGSKNFWQMHHYCWALIDVRRAQMPGLKPEIKRGNLERALGNCQYVIDRGTADFVLLPEIYTKIGDIAMMLNAISRATDAYARARELRPDYWPAYTHWADVLIKSGLKSEAAELVRTGLSYSPDAVELQRQYRLLGGNPAEVPVAKKPEAAASDAADPATTAASVAASQASP